MPLGVASDLAFMLRDAGETVVYNGVSSSGILEIMDALEPTDGGGMVQTKATTVLVASAAFDNLRQNATVTVAGIGYRIDRVAPEDDGAVTRLYLARRT